MGRIIFFLIGGSLLFYLTGCSKLGKIADYILIHGLNITSKITRAINTSSNSECTFDHYTGFRDWYRFPLKYPYHFIMIDLLTQGNLEKYNGGNIQEPLQSSKGIENCSRIIRLYWNDQIIVFDRADQKFGIFIFQHEICHIFATKEERNMFLNKHYSFLQFEMHTPEYYFNQFKKKI